MSSFTPEQVRAINHENGNIMISASAGSGKTSVMIERAVKLITEKKANVNEILAITFTEISATDMKEKLRNKLISKISETKDRRLIEQLNLVQTSDISTIHSFCGRLIRSYFFVAGVSPDFRIIDNEESKIFKDTALNNVFTKVYQEKDEEILNVIDRHSSGRRDLNLKNIIMELYFFAISEPYPYEYLDEMLYNYTDAGFNGLLAKYKSSIDGELDVIYRRLQSLKEQFGLLNSIKNAQFIELLMRDIEVVKGTRDIYSIKQFENYKRDLVREQKLSCELTELKSELKEYRDYLQKLFNGVNSVISDYETDREKVTKMYSHANVIVRLVKEFMNTYAEIKEEENGLDFNDLEHFALKVLGDIEIRQDISRRYKYIFVDEYQDVNATQEEIIRLISNDNLFLVGDEKQSIYGFRGCRPEIFKEKFNKMREGELSGETIRLNKNFRSASNVVNFVNDIFSYSMTDEIYGLDYSNEAKLIFGGLYGDGFEGRAKLHILNYKKDRDGKSEEARIYNVLDELNSEEDDEQESIALLVTDIINKELSKKYYDLKSGKEQYVTFSDIAILTRNKDNEYVKSLVSGLIRHGIPVSSQVAENVLEYGEIKLVISVLQLIDCFRQDIPLVTVLKSPIGKITEEELAEICSFYTDNKDDALSEKNKSKKGWQFFDAYEFYLKNAKTDLHSKLSAFNNYFNELRFVGDFLSAHDIISRVIHDNDLEAHLYATRGGDAKVKRLRRFVAYAFESTSCTIKEFLSRVEQGDGISLAESSGENTVKVMTIHQSKGLEFPVVIVCGLERRMNTSDENKEVMLERDLGMVLKSYDDETRQSSENIFRACAKQKLKENRIKEELRLFYVALTRAKYSLNITLVDSKDSRRDKLFFPSKFIDYVPKYLLAQNYDTSDFDFNNLKLGTRKVLFGKVDESVKESMCKNFAYVYPNELDTVLPIKSNVTSVAVKQEFYRINELFDEQDSADVKTGVERGTLAHKFLELYDFSKSCLENASGVVTSGEMTSDEIKLIDVEKIGGAVDCSLFKNLDGYTVYREQPFIVNIPANMILDTQTKSEVLLQGVIDFMAIGKSDGIVVDYKYSKLTSKALKDKYKKQLELYSFAIEKLLNVKVDKKYILNIFSGELISLA